MSKEKKSILSKLFKGSSGCNCGMEIVENKDENTNDNKANEKNRENN